MGLGFNVKLGRGFAMPRSKTWFVAMCTIVLGIVMLVNGYFFVGLVLLLAGCALKLLD